MGLYRLDKPLPQDVGARYLVNVIAIHGLNGHSERSWIHKSSGTFWLRDLLNHDLPGARAYTYSYASQIIAKHVMKINGFARDLLAVISGERNSEETRKRPIMLICHSMGGLVAKKALIVAKEEPRYANILDMTQGIVFFATPHRGSSEADRWSGLASIAKIAYGDLRADHIRNLRAKSLSDELFGITQSFRSISSGFGIISVYETLPTIQRSVIVPKESALMNLPNEDQIPRNADHRSVCTFASSTSDGYTSIVSKIKELLQPMTEIFEGFSAEETACMQELYTSEYETHRALIETPVNGTCIWLLEHPKFTAWLEDHTTSLLWLCGGAGCGKSVLMSFIIKKLLQEAGEGKIQATVYYYFCDDKNQAQRSATSVLCGILHQLIASKPPLIKHVLGPYQAKGRRIAKELKTLWDILVAMLADSAAGNVMLIIDALDECEHSTRQPLLDWISEFVKEPRFSQSYLKILVTSRPEFSITKTLRSTAVQVKMEDEMQKLELDIRTVVTQKLEELAYSSELTKEIEQHIIGKADGTFLWVALTLRLLEESGDSSYEGLMGILHYAHSGADLFGVYASILKLTPEYRQVEARKVLQIAAIASRPLTIEEFNLAIVINRTDQTGNDLRRRLQQDFPRYILRLCGPFLRIIDQRVHLVHQTAKEFLLNRNEQNVRSFWTFEPKEAHFLLAQICIWYLLLDCSTPQSLRSEGSVKPQSLIKTSTCQLGKPKDDLFLAYCAIYWPEHFREGQTSADDETIHKAKLIHNTADPWFLRWFKIF